MRKKLAALLLVTAVLALCSCGDTDGYENTGDTCAAPESLSFVDTSVPTESAGTDDHKEYEFEKYMIDYGSDGAVEYSDGYFTQPSGACSAGLAAQSLALAVSAFGAGSSSGYSTDRNLSAFFAAAGFTGYRAGSGFSGEPTEYSIGAGFAHKAVAGRTVVAVAVRGGGYYSEWYSNFDVGSEGDHRGFSAAADTLVRELSEYVTDEGISGGVSFWISGYSRGAAVANLLAARIIDGNIDEKASSSVEYGAENVYAYCFETPAATVAEDCRDGRYAGIINVINSCDFVCRVAPYFWGFDRYGTDIYLPSPTTDAIYYERCEDVGVSAPELSVSTVGLLSKSVIESKKYSNYNIEIFIDDLFDAAGVCVPDREAYARESEAICAFIGMIGGGELRSLPGSDLSNALNGLSGILTARDEASLGAAIRDTAKSMFGDEKAADITEAFLHAVYRLFGSSALENLTYIVTTFVNIGDIAYQHYPSLCAALLSSVSDGEERSEREYAVLTFDIAADIEVYCGDALAAKLDGKYKALTLISSPLPYSADDSGTLRLMLPAYIDTADIKITAQDAAEGYITVAVRDGLGASHTEDVISISVNKNGTAELSVKNPAYRR